MKRAVTLLSLSVPLILVVACEDEPTVAPDITLPDAAIDTAPANDAATDVLADAGTDLPRAGSRLVPRFVTSVDGLKTHVGIFDTKLDAICSPSTLYDTATRCAPIVNHTSADLFYADASCTRPAISEVSQNECTPARFANVQVGVTDTCGNGAAFALYRIVVAKLDLTSVYAKGSDGACTVNGPPGSYTEVALVPTTDLVKLTEGNQPLTQAIGTNVLAGDDGSVFPTLLTDRARQNAECRVAKANDDKLRCVPASGASVSDFTDDGCTKEAVTVPQCVKAGDPNASVVVTYLNANCVSKVRVNAVGAKRATRTTYSGSPANCSGPTTATTDVFDLGAETPATSFPELTSLDQGGSRVVANASASNGVPVYFDTGTFKDKTANGPCIFAEATDGKLRCLPEAAPVQYSDATCQTRAAVQFERDCIEPKVGRLTAEACPRRTTIYALGAKLAGTTAYYGTPQDCNPIPVKAMFALGAEVPPSTFAEGAYVPK